MVLGTENDFILRREPLKDSLFLFSLLWVGKCVVSNDSRNLSLFSRFSPGLAVGPDQLTAVSEHTLTEPTL